MPQKGRRKKVRYIQTMPKIDQFSPRGKPGRPDEVQLTVDEFESVKLADYQGYDQIEGAKIMGISRSSFGRILRKAREKLAKALVEGSSIRIRIGDVQIGVTHKALPHKDDLEMMEQQEVEKEKRMRDKILNHQPKIP
ncbi:MAG: DUF134 domain-containing protein [Candidatus Omnitrophica bacterium]|nr:DUF134 domain-containing protein [Candidatus Omnitrophota bacterium]